MLRSKKPNLSGSKHEEYLPQCGYYVFQGSWWFLGYYLYVEQNKIDILALGPIFGIVISWLQNKKNIHR